MTTKIVCALWSHEKEHDEKVDHQLWRTALRMLRWREADCSKCKNEGNWKCPDSNGVKMHVTMYVDIIDDRRQLAASITIVKTNVPLLEITIAN